MPEPVYFAARSTVASAACLVRVRGPEERPLLFRPHRWSFSLLSSSLRATIYFPVPYNSFTFSHSVIAS